MTDSVAQLIAGGLVIAIAVVSFLIGHGVGKKRGAREALSFADGLDEPYRGEPRREGRPPRPPTPPTVVH